MCVQSVLRGWDMKQTLWEIKLWSLPFPTPSLSLCLATEPVTPGELLCQPGMFPRQ